MKKIKYCLYATIIVLIISCRTGKQETNESNQVGNYWEYLKKSGKTQKFKEDLVPDEKTAIKIANAIWDVKYSAIKGVRDLPYTVLLEENKIWFIQTNLPKGAYGMVLSIRISKNDGQVLYLWAES